MGKNDLDILKNRAASYLKHNDYSNCAVKTNKQKIEDDYVDRFSKDTNKKVKPQGKDYSKTWVQVYVNAVGSKR